MKLKHMYKRNKMIRWYKFKKRIRKQLPKYNDRTGEPLEWDISIMHYNTIHCILTGEMLEKGLPYLSIVQSRPHAITDVRAYRYNWKKKKIEIIQGAQWEYIF